MRCHVGSGVEGLGKNVFHNSKVEEAILPESLKKIGDSAFNGFKPMKSITIPEGVEKMEGRSSMDATASVPWSYPGT